jgi:hypothetical protein
VASNRQQELAQCLNMWVVASDKHPDGESQESETSPALPIDGFRRQPYPLSPKTECEKGVRG